MRAGFSYCTIKGYMERMSHQIVANDLNANKI